MRNYRGLLWVFFFSTGLEQGLCISPCHSCLNRYNIALEQIIFFFLALSRNIFLFALRSVLSAIPALIFLNLSPRHTSAPTELSGGILLTEWKWIPFI